MLQRIALIELFICWLAWMAAFVPAKWAAFGQKKAVVAPAARWGIALQIVAFVIVCSGVRTPGYQKWPASLVVSMILPPLAVALAWAATRRLGKQWRYDAALNEDHELIQAGAYALIRHPIYASMLVMFLAIGCAWTMWPLFAAALAAFIAGVEIRVRAEERLLASRFGDAFTAYKFRVPAYVPFVR